MTRNKQKLELTWIGKDERPRLEPRILVEHKKTSYHAAHRISDKDIFDNILIKGDNLLALKALEQEFTGKIKCVYIDPPYNTGSAFAHYDDGIEHSLWLSLIRDRLEILRKLLSEDGSIWITLDDNEVFYAKVLCDEVFGRPNFVSSIAWNSRKSKQNDTKISLGHNFLLLYAKNKESVALNRLPTKDDKFSNPDNDPRGAWTADPFDAPNLRPNLTYEIVNPNTGVSYLPPNGRCWRTTPREFERYLAEGMIVFGKTGKSKPQLKRYLTDATTKGETPGTWWDDVGTTTEATQHLQNMFGGKTFDTPKPERLIERVLQISTKEDDLVLDSFGGSGTTGAVAHKMRRRWIMVELGEHCSTNIVPRLKKVIDGEDAGGITNSVEWKGGGGFRFYELAPSLLKKDKWDNYIINPEYNAEMLAEALCKHLGFTYEPSDTVFWEHGHSTETDFIYVTTQQLSRETLQKISDEVGEERTLLICCKAFRAGEREFPNLTLQKIPKTILGRCEWDRDDYSLQVQNLPLKPEEKGTQPVFSFESE